MTDTTPGFSVSLDVYQGPFDALLSLLADRRLELTEISLGSITEEFLAYVKRLDLGRNLDEASSFLDVASVLVEAKSAALLPGQGESPADEQSMEALRERDLLFARLLQYRAFKEAASVFERELARVAASLPHPGRVDERTAAALPSLVWTTSPPELARMAAHALVNAPASQVSVAQLHVPMVDLREQAELVRARLQERPGEPLAFAAIIGDAAGRLEVVARFLAILVFFRQREVQYKQAGPFEPLYLRWIGDVDNGGGIDVSEKDFS
ncbi:segregation/condensation protein A [Bifidobacterium xylocopae]|uniref:Segregation and condensation protein A n=1 Tax=Bifidobacterium xylocopae TaxID=2493119 RepID=A0A366KAN0_9BIFI|nr:segregation/condensation protein A [Bifidobacterium xylocopae]